jgi:hypothetical protein
VPYTVISIICSFYLFISKLCLILQRNSKKQVMNTMVGTVPMDAVLTMLNSLSRHDRRWLAEQMMERVKREEADAKKHWEELRKNAPTWEEEDNASLDAFLTAVGGDWGGDASPAEIAADLRQDADMVRNVDSW